MRKPERKVQLSMVDLQERAEEVEVAEKELVDMMSSSLTSSKDSLLGAEQVLSIFEREMKL